MPNRHYYRADYGDTAPRVAHPQEALDFTGALKPAYFTNEAAAWAAILAHHKESAEHSERRYKQLDKALETATAEMVKRRADQRAATHAYQEWRARVA